MVIVNYLGRIVAMDKTGEVVIMSIAFIFLFALTFRDVLKILSLVQQRRLDTSVIICISLIIVIDSSLWYLWFYIYSHIN